MADSETELNRNSILYELLLLSEWIEDHDSVVSKNALNNSIQESASYINLWNLFRQSKFYNLRFLETEYPWHLAVSKDGKVIAVLQETLLEIKTAKDEFSSVVGKACIPSDQCPKLRKLCWSPDNSFLAVARDNGTVLVFNLFGCNVATVEVSENSGGVLEPVVGLCFLHSKFDSSKWSNELLIIYHKGNVKSILLSHLDGHESVENINCSLESYYPEGILSVAYSSHHLLVIAGPPSGNEHGITVWRILNDYPYLKPAIDSDKSSTSSRSFFRLLFGLSKERNAKTVVKMQISPNEKSLACIHLSGEVSIWKLPGILLERKWSLHEQPQFNKCNPQKNENVKSDKFFHPVDISWWSDNALVIARQNGALSVCDSKTLDNLLGDSPEFLANAPQISCIVSGIVSGVVALECETTCNCKNTQEDIENFSDKDNETSVLQASIQAALYSVTDIEMFEPKRKVPKVKQRTYRLLALKRTTPEELYTRKIDLEEYEEALLLAKKYSLDCDLVYQKRWRNSEVSKESITEYLDKVKKIVWVVKECVERVPENYEDAKKLLEFGLEKTELKNTKVSSLSSEEKQLVIYRRQLLKFLDSLTIYEKMIGSPTKYNSTEYDGFRKKPALVATVNFARKENWQAVSIMFTYAGNMVLAHWLPILSNFPETLKPLFYRSLLPELVDNKPIPWEVRKLRDLDWSEVSPFESLNPKEDNDWEILYKEDFHLKEFQAEILTAELVSEWYKKRTYELESKTGLVENALKMVVLAKERGIKNLNQLHNNLLTLESLVYLLGDTSITLTQLESLTHLEQCKLLLAKTSKDTFIDDLKNLIVPFTKRCKEQNCDSTYDLLRDILLHFSECSLELPFELLNYLKGGYLNPFMLSLNETVSIVLDCIYSCPKDDQLETCFFILECLPQRENSNNREDAELHDRIDRLEIHLETCEILERYKTPKSVRFIKENENNVEVGKELMENMSEYTKRESLDFTELLTDLRFIRSKLFTSIPESFCYELCVLSQMSCECEEIIQSAEELIECRRGEKDKMVPFEKTVELVLLAAKNHFEKATNFDDYCIQLAQTCLKLIGEPHPLIYQELDLIEAVQLLGDFHVNVLPIQVRKNDHRLDLIESCLKAKLKNYKACQRLLQLAQTLRIYGDDRLKREGEILVMIAEYALNSSDYQYCSEICHRLVSRNFPPAWTIVRLLAQAGEYENKDNKKLFFAFAMLHCPLENLEECIESRIELHQKYFE